MCLSRSCCRCHLRNIGRSGDGPDAAALQKRSETLDENCAQNAQCGIAGNGENKAVQEQRAHRDGGVQHVVADHIVVDHPRGVHHGEACQIGSKIAGKGALFQLGSERTGHVGPDAEADDIAKAILNYERALLLQPGNADIRANLEIARSKTIDKVVSVPDIFFVAWVKSLINCLSVDAWAKLGIVFFILLLISFSLFFLSKQIVWKKSGFIAGIAFLFLVALSNIFASEQKSELMNRNKAIILSPSVTVRSTPSESGTSLFILHEGHKIEVKDNSMREWKEIRLEDGKVGWVPTSAIEVI